MSVEYEPSITTVLSRSPASAWILQSLFTSLLRAVRGVRGRVPIPARAPSCARARAFADQCGASCGNRRPTDHRAGHFSPRRSARQAPTDPYRIARRGRCHRARVWSPARVCYFPARQCRARFGACTHCAHCRRDDAHCSARPISIWVGARCSVGYLCCGLPLLWARWSPVRLSGRQASATSYG